MVKRQAGQRLLAPAIGDEDFDETRAAIPFVANGTFAGLNVDQEELMRVLVAEDDLEMRVLLAHRLRTIGLEVVEAASGDEALSQIEDAILEERYFDLVVADVHKPGQTGLDVLACVRESDWKTPVILIGGFATAGTHDEVCRLGASAVFDRPFDLEDLLAAVLNAAPPLD